MNDKNNIELTREERMARAEAAMNRMILIVQKVKDGEATESELAEYKKVSEKVDRIPINTLTG